VVALAAVVMMRRASFQASTQPAYLLNLRVGIGHDLEQLFGPLLDQHLAARELQSIATARQGAALDVAYYARLRQDGSTTDLVTALNRLEGVQSVQLERRTPEQE
jgi:hypothetical protein